MSALFLRLYDLDSRPMHGDEANQAVKTGILLEDGKYVYDPHDHHGPTLYYFGLLTAKSSGHAAFRTTNETTFRVVPVLFGVILVVLTFGLRTYFSTPAALVSSLLIALSPAFVFYSRYYIQEMMLVVFTLAALFAAFSYIRKPTAVKVLMFGATFSLMHATKETAILSYAAMAGSAALVALWYQKTNPDKAFKTPDEWKYHLVLGISVAVVMNILLFTSFFTNARGPIDSILTYGNYLERSDGAGLHDKPFFYYLSLLSFTHRAPGPWWSEAGILFLAVLGFVDTGFSWKKKAMSPAALFIAAYTLLLTTAYCLIPYKTPWSMLSFYFGIIIMAGVGTIAAWNWLKPVGFLRVLAILLFTAISAHLASQAWQQNHRYQADPRNPYVYAHTSSAFMKLANRFEQIRAVHPDPENMVVKVYQPDGDYWPIPWYLRNNPLSGYWSNSLPDDLEADIIVSAPELRGLLTEKLTGAYFKEMHGLRPNVLRHVYIRQELWDRFMEGQR